MNRRRFIKAGALFVPATFGILIPGKANILPHRRSAWRKHSPPAGGAGPFTFVASATGYIATAGSTTVSTSTALNVAAGDLLCAFPNWQDAETGNTIVVDENDGTDVFTSGAVVVNSNDAGGAFSYLLNAPADASFTVRATTQACRRFGIIVYQFRPTTPPAALDAITTLATGSSTALASATLSTSVANSVVFGCGVSASGSQPVTGLIGGVAAGGLVSSDVWGSLWYRIPTTTLSTITANATAGNDLWVCGIVAFK